MKIISTTTAKVKNNPLYSVLGAVAGVMIARKMLKGKKNWYVLVGSAVAGTLVGAYAGGMIKSNAGKPNAGTTK